MIASHHGLIKQLFLQALERPVVEREAFVHAECDDAAVLAEVLRLLDVRRELTDRLGTPCAVGFGPTEGTPYPDDDACTHPGRRGRAAAVPELVLERYELEEVLGAGAFGTVFRARDRITGHAVAVKLTPLERAKAMSWHVREVATLRRARIPGVVDLLETGQVDQWAVIVMALVEGSPFPGDGVAPGDTETILSRTVALLEAVSQLLALGVYHRDLKPSNVLVSANGVVTVVDLGIAEDETDAARWRDDGLAPGTRGYMAPERREGRRATARTELYSVGVMVIEALGASLGFDVSMSTESGHDDARHDEKLAALESELAPEIAVLLRSMVAADPEERPADPRDALDALRTLLGPSHSLELPWIGGDDVVAAIVDAARGARALDIVGAPGSGRTRALLEAERRLREAGFLVQWIRPAPPASQLLPVPSNVAPSPEEADCEAISRLRQRLEDGLVVLVDDHDLLPEVTRELVDSLRDRGTVIRVVQEPAGECIETTALSRGDLEGLVRGPERLVHLPSETAALLWRRTRGCPREIVREIRTWVATGLASWRGALHLKPSALDRIRALTSSSASLADLPAELAASNRETWTALSVVAAPITVEALADVLNRPRRFVAHEVRSLTRLGFVHEDEEGALVVVRASPEIAEVPRDTRRVWSVRATRHLPSCSEARFLHLLAAEQHEVACFVAIDLARSQMQSGGMAAALSVLDQALAVARKHAPEAHEVYSGLLSLMAEAALGRATPQAIDLALYHANLAPVPGERVAGWTKVLGAAATLLGGDPRGAITRLENPDRLPSETHRRFAHVVAHFAARMLGHEELRLRTVGIARWARHAGGREAQSLLASAVGWLRYQEGRYSAASRSQVRASRLTRRRRTRTTALCDAAMAALESGDFSAARDLAGTSLASAVATSDRVNEARAELTLRQALYRSGRARDVDEDLLDGAARLEDRVTRGTLRLNEAAVAWRSRQLARGAELAELAVEDLELEYPDAAALARALAGACAGHRADSSLESLAALRMEERPGIGAQALALGLGRRGSRAQAPELVAQARAWAESTPLENMPREVLSPREVLHRLNDTR